MAACVVVEVNANAVRVSHRGPLLPLGAVGGGTYAHVVYSRASEVD